jgi:hypothetical protein
MLRKGEFLLKKTQIVDDRYIIKESSDFPSILERKAIITL